MSNFAGNRPTVADLHRRMMGEDRGIFHTHAYAHAAGGRFGAVGGGSFAQRRELERSRQTVGSYRNAMVSNIPQHVGEQRINPGPTRGSLPASSPRATFHEPPTRAYNPYG